MSVTPQAGDIVKLISGGPDMTVEKYEPEAFHSVHCIFFNDAGALARGAFASVTLNAVGQSTTASEPAPDAKQYGTDLPGGTPSN